MEDVKKKFPDLDGRAVLKVISKMWEEVPDAKKDVMSADYQEEYDDYLVRMEKWRAKYNIEPERKSKSKTRSSRSKSKSARSRSKSRSKSKSRRR